MTRTAAGALLLAVAVLTGCGQPPGGGASGETAGGRAGASGTGAGGSADGCPPVEPGRGGAAVMVDYVDFVQAHGRQYVAGLGASDATVSAATVSAATLSADEVGPVQFRVRCSLRELNSRADQMPPPARDGDAGLLPAGTPVHEVRGWSPLCRLAAQRDGVWRVYLAVDSSTATATAAPTCQRLTF